MEIRGKKIILTRGDSGSITVAIRDGAFASGDKVEFTVRKKIDDPTKSIYKCITTFDQGKALIILQPEDTKRLNVRPYVYDIQITRQDGTVLTPVRPPEAMLILEGDVTD